MTNTLASRYIGSSEAIKMQTDATATIAEATAQGFAKVNQANQQFLQTQIQNSQANVQQTQQLAQIELAGRDNKIKDLADIASATIENLDKRKELKAIEQAKLAKVEQERLNKEAEVKYTQQIANLTDSYLGSNWEKGVDRYKSEAALILSTIPSQTDSSLKLKLMQNVYETSKARNAQVGSELQKETEALRDNQTAVERSKLMFQLTPILESVATQSLDEQATPFLNRAQSILKQFLSTDNGLPYSKKLSVVADTVEAINTSYSKKYGRWSERTTQLQDLNSYARQYKELEARYTAGQITWDEMRNSQATLNVMYPGFEDNVTKVGDKEREDLALSQLTESQRKLAADAGASAIANITFTDETVKQMIAGAFTDPGFYSKLRDDPKFKDNPQFQQVVRGADRLTEYFKQENQLIVSQASALTDFRRLDLSNVQTITQLQRSFLLKRKSNKQLSPSELLAQQAIEQMAQTNPAIAELYGRMQQSDVPIELSAQEQAEISQTLQQESAGIKLLQNSIAGEVEAKRAALYRNFPELVNYGLIGQSQEAIREYAKRVAPSLEKERERIDRARAEAINQVVKPQYGVQPNFNPSSGYGTSLDDKGNLRVVPRVKAASVKHNGTTITIPLVSGSTSSISGRWNDNRGTHRHAGVDFPAPVGTKTIALVPGTVVNVGSNPGGYGNYVDVLGDNGYLYRYAHGASNVRSGQRLKAGDFVSTLDNSGRSSGSHLHFEVIPNPSFNADGTYNRSGNFGSGVTVDPLNHLQQMSIGSSNVLRPRTNNSVYRRNPQLSVPSNSLLTGGGGAINGGTYQRQGGIPGKTKNRFGGNRPVTTSKAPFNVMAGAVDYDYNDNFGYAELESDQKLRAAFVNAAKRLGVPAVWLVDIARQESGGINPHKDHDGNAYGLFGHQSDSFNDKSIHQNLRAGKIDGPAQLDLYVRYMNENGWDKLLKKRNGQVSIADVWAFTRMGWNMRHKYWDSQNVNIAQARHLPAYPAN